MWSLSVDGDPVIYFQTKEEAKHFELLVRAVLWRLELKPYRVFVREVVL